MPAEGILDEDLPHQVIGACMNVYGFLGPGLTREAYEECVAVELRGLEIPFERGKPLNFVYQGQNITAAARMDFVIADSLLLQVHAGAEVGALEKQQLETLLRLSGIKSGLLVNFNVPIFRKAVHRVTLKRRSAPEA
jgi:GxxExxY protein